MASFGVTGAGLGGQLVPAPMVTTNAEGVHTHTIAAQVAQARFSSPVSSPPLSSHLHRFRNQWMYDTLYKSNAREEFFSCAEHHFFNVSPATILKHARLLYEPLLHKFRHVSLKSNLERFVTICQQLGPNELMGLTSLLEPWQLQKHFQFHIQDSDLKGFVDPKNKCIDHTKFISAFRTLISSYPAAIHPSVERFNRHPNILPLEATRVMLTNRAYINANYCHDKQMIICQTPIISPHVDERENFYTMLWDNDTTAIVMLTGGQEQNSGYLGPSKQNLSIQWCAMPLVDFKMTKEGANRLPTKRIKLSKKDLENLQRLGIITTEVTLQKEGYRKTVLHFQIDDWAKGESGNARSIAVLAHLMLIMKRPVLLCNTGTDRSGALAAIIIAYRKIQNFIGMDQAIPASCIKEVVEDLRKERDHCVATADQYQMIFDVLKIMFNLPG